jgi:hypothetical protein
MCLDISTLAKNITDRREYNFFRKISSKSRLIAWVGSQSPFLSRQRIDLKSGCSGASQRRQSYPRPYRPPFPHRRHISLFCPKLIPLSVGSHPNLSASGGRRCSDSSGGAVLSHTPCNGEPPAPARTVQFRNFRNSSPISKIISRRHAS